MDVKITPVVRYWDYEPHQITGLLQNIKESGADTIGAFVPWSLVEEDRKQQLSQFVRQINSFGLKARLILSPELGMGFPNAGVPDRLLKKRENLAQDRSGQTIFSCIPPNIHPLVNLVAPEVFQSYGHYLLKLCQDLTKLLGESSVEDLELIVSDSFFKNYSTFGLAASDHGDYSPLYYQRELDSIRDWSHAQAERTFRARAIDVLENRFSRFSEIKISNKSMASDSASIDALMDEIFGAEYDFAQKIRELNDKKINSDFVFLSSFAKCRKSDQGPLISGAMALYGDVWLMAEDWLSCRKNFCRKLTELAKSLSGDNCYFERPALSIVQNRFAPARLSSALEKILGTNLRMSTFLSDVDVQELKTVKMLVVEEALEISQDHFESFLTKAENEDCTIALFRSSLSEESLKKFTKLKTFRISHGWKYEIAIFDSGGHFIVIDGHEASISTMDMLASRLVAVAEIAPVYRIDQKNMIGSLINWDNSKILFLINPDESEHEVKVHFNEDMAVEGIGGGAQEQREGAKTIKIKLPAQSVAPILLDQEIEKQNENPQSELDLDNETKQDGPETQLAQI